MAERAQEERERWEEAALAHLEAQPGYEVITEKLAEAKEEAAELIEEAAAQADQVMKEAAIKIEAAAGKFNAARQKAEQELEDVELPRVEPIEPELEDAPEPIYTSKDDWIEATLKLKNRKELVPDEEC